MFELLIMGWINVSIYTVVKCMVYVFCTYILGSEPKEEWLMIISLIIAAWICVCVNLAWNKENTKEIKSWLEKRLDRIESWLEKGVK